MPRPVIALLTDFGTRDHYVGTMKGVMLGICPDLVLVDISHEIPPQDVAAGALELAAAFRYFPAGTVFLAVVDPGVGSKRRAIAAEVGEHRFVAPDNGLLAPVFEERPPRRVVELTAPEYARPAISWTFEGRDRFAPAAAWLARGVHLEALGPPVSRPEGLALPRPVVSDAGVVGEVVRVDRFGNLITNIDRTTFDDVAARGGVEGVEIVVGRHPIGRLAAIYAEAEPGALCALFGSSGHLEVAANGASAAAALGLGRGAPVHVTRRA
jgi:S-adenosyl-L-methionine hydrolase (adenosine-forming)